MSSIGRRKMVVRNPRSTRLLSLLSRLAVSLAMEKVGEEVEEEEPPLRMGLALPIRPRHLRQQSQQVMSRHRLSCSRDWRPAQANVFP